ncbi:MAG: hypothetical protein AB1730_12385 [Myxococcota bacterium]|jgi:hypothetical protein
MRPTAAPPSEPAALAPALPASPVRFDDGFCPESGVESFDLRFTLPRLLVGELRRRAEAGVGADAHAVLLRDAVRTPEAPGVLERARQAAIATPDDASAQVTLAVVARAQGRHDEQLAALRRARALLPNVPAVGFALAEATRDGAELDEALDGLSTYLAADPSPGPSRLRARLELQRDMQRDYHRLTRGGVTVLWPPELLSEAQAADVASTVHRDLDAAAAFTGSPRRARLTVVIYPSRSELLAVSCVPAWSGGLSDGTLRVVAAGDGVVNAVALRHEPLHARLTSLGARTPRWFDEGVAQAFAGEPEPRPRWELMRKNRTSIPFSSLDGSFSSIHAAGDAGLACAQSYAMVELMRERGGDGVIATALAAFRAGADGSTALARACRQRQVTHADLLAFLDARLSRAR